MIAGQLADRIIALVEKHKLVGDDKKVIEDLWVAYETEAMDGCVAESKLDGRWNGHAGLLHGAP